MRRGRVLRFFLQLQELAIDISFKWKMNFLCRLYSWKKRNNSNCQEIWDISTSVHSTESQNHGQKADGACYTIHPLPVISCSFFPHLHTGCSTAIQQILATYIPQSLPRLMIPSTGRDPDSVEEIGHDYFIWTLSWTFCTWKENWGFKSCINFP